ncbi:MAG: hypothetical protein EU533_03435 [Promethearchaeota archaeon]|nr:MAG: hypothetical protein EU533_03435 [Candidatus Lokiarchaeota archaeon]
MPSEDDSQEDNEQKNPRISVKIQDDFDYRVITKMAKNRDMSLSGAVRDIVHQWILQNTETLNKTYNVDIDEINEEIFLETATLSYDKQLKPLEESLINELPGFFEMVEIVDIEDLAEHFEVPVKTIKKIIFSHANVIKNKGLNLTVREGKIYKEGVN